MPTYDYACDACEHTFEQWQSFKDDALTKCPACKKNKLERLFGGGGAIIFKGSGFYETDYRRTGEKKADAEPAKAETKSDAKADAAPASPPPPAASDGAAGKTGKAAGKGGAAKAG